MGEGEDIFKLKEHKIKPGYEEEMARSGGMGGGEIPSILKKYQKNVKHLPVDEGGSSKSKSKN